MKTFVGIDISNTKLDVQLCDSSCQELGKVFKVNNTPKGVSKLIKRISKNKDVWVCFEHTGSYGLLLTAMLEEANITYSAVSAIEIKKSIGLTRGKNDQVDATRIAIYAASNIHKLSPSEMPGKDLLSLRELMSYRRFLVKQRTQNKNLLKQKKIVQQVTDVSLIIEDLEQKIKTLNSEIKSIENKILKLIEENEELEVNYSKMIKIKGIGPMCATAILIYTSNFSQFDCARKFNCYSGLAPFNKQSGTSLKTKSRTSNLRNKILKTLLISGAKSASIHDPQLRAYFQRKIAQGKNKHAVVNAIACKLIYRVFAVIKREEPYVIFNQ